MAPPTAAKQLSHELKEAPQDLDELLGCFLHVKRSTENKIIQVNKCRLEV